jgi:hypothetical protein
LGGVLVENKRKKKKKNVWRKQGGRRRQKRDNPVLFMKGLGRDCRQTGLRIWTKVTIDHSLRMDQHITS